MAIKITKSAVDALRAQDKVQFAFDSDVTGFGIKVSTAGRKSYLVQYRINGRKRRYFIGVHGSPWTPDKAREEAKRLLGLVASGRDPADEKAEHKRDITISALCDLYLAEGCETKKPGTVAIDEGRIKRHIKPLLGTRQISGVTKGDVDKFMRDVANGKTAARVDTKKRGRAVVTGGKGTATKAVSLLSAIYSFAVERKLVEVNPCLGVKKYKDQKRERFLSNEEFMRLGDALNSVEADSPVAVAAVRLLALTGCRRGEILSLRWEDIQKEQRIIVFADSKTGRKAIPMTDPVAEVIDTLPWIKDCPYIFAGRGGKPFQGLPKVWQKIKNEAGLEDVRLHDLRHSFASVGAMGGGSLYIIGKLLGHTQQSTTQRYAHLADDPLRKAANTISLKIAEAMTINDRIRIAERVD